MPTVIAAAFMLIVTVGFFVSLAFWREAADERNAKEEALTAAVEQRRLAETARDEAQRQTEIAQAVNDFLNKDLLGAVDLMEPASTQDTRGRASTVREVLDAASERIGERFEGRPLVEASIRMTLGAAYESLGEYELAEPHLQAALELRRAALGGEHQQTHRSLAHLAVLYREQGRYDKAEPLLLAVLEARRRLSGEDHPDTLAAMASLAELYREQGRYEEAELLHLKVLEVRRRMLGADHAAKLCLGEDGHKGAAPPRPGRRKMPQSSLRATER